MTPIGPEEATMQHAQHAQQPRHERQLKDDTHHKDEHQEGVHVAVKGNLIGNQGAHVIVGKEAQRDRKDHIVAHEYAQEEHQAAHQKGRLDAPLLIRVQRRGDKGPQLIQEEGEGQYQRKPERRGHVDKELRGELDVNELDFKAAGSELWQPGNRGRHPLKQAVKHKVTMTRCQDH